MAADTPKTRAFSITDADMKIILKAARENKEQSGVANTSAALRRILREWNEMASLRPKVTTVSLTHLGEAVK